MVLHYAVGGNFNSWMNKNYNNFNWLDKLVSLWNIIRGLNDIHQSQIVHRDFHTGNILLNIDVYDNDISDDSIYISDMGLCGEATNTDESNVYGVMPYVAPEVLRGYSYTQSADVYSFGMIMYFVATRKQPFSNCAHDQCLALDICEGTRPEINVPEAPECYIDLMRRCWDSDPDNRPKADEIKELISLFIGSYRDNELRFKYYMKIDKDQQHYEIEKQFKEAEEYRILCLHENKISASFEEYEQLTSFEANSQSIFFEENEQTTHSQAIYTSRLLNPFTKDLSRYNDDECLECTIDD
jgi:serine/threonine protein kinase